MKFWLPDWVLKKQDERFLQALIDTRAQSDEVSDRHVRFILVRMRFARAIEPYTRIFKLGWEIIRGRYWKSSSQIRGGSNAVSGGSTGTYSQSGPAAQFTGPVFTFNPITTPAAGPSGITGAGYGRITDSRFEDAGIVAGEIVAYRSWLLRGDGLLYSVFMDSVCWIPETVMLGDANAGDGIHAFKTALDMVGYGNFRSDAGAIIVTGTVYLWGDVYEHERGYRASMAAVRSIDDSPFYDAKALRKLYGLNKRRKKPLQKPEA